MTSAPIVDIDRLVKRFGAGSAEVTALDGLSASIEGGQVTGLVGPDGAGKTTLLRLMAGILRPDGGQVRVFGRDPLAEAGLVQADIGYLPQRFGLYEDLTVAENLSFYADLDGLYGDVRRRRLDDLLAFTDLARFEDRLAGKLSGGMKQKLGLACALIRRPRLLLLDEPSVGVDPVSRRELWRIVYDLVGEGMSVVWSTAYLDEAERCQDVILLHQGRLLDAGPPAGFGKAMAGRTIEIRPEPGRKRALARRLKSHPDVLDAVVKGRAVRLLTTATPDLAALGKSIDDFLGQRTGMSTVSPVFEDAFIARLASGRENEVSAGGEARIAAPMPEPVKAASPAIEVRDLTRTFGAFRAVDRVSFSVDRGEIFGLLGPNGAGKSTTFKMLLGLLPPTGGTARVLGIDLRHAAVQARERYGYMAQRFSLYGDMTVHQNLRFFAQAYGVAGRERIDWAMAEFDLGRYVDVDAAKLSLGFKQRLALACALMHEPGILFLDEPTSGVDPLVRRSFWERISALAENGVTVLVTTHFMDEAEYCDRLGVIYRGRIVAEGSPDDLKAKVATAALPEPTLEDAFVGLVEASDRELVA